MNYIVVILGMIVILCIVLVYISCYTSLLNFTNNETVINKQEVNSLKPIETFHSKKLKSNQSKSNTNSGHSGHSLSEKNLLMKLRQGTKTCDVELRLFDYAVPLTCKNFRFIAKKGIQGKTYNNNIFHRVIPDFMLQGGDILNRDGTGSISVYGENFEDENFKLKHDKGGLLSMANSGPNTNGSQFFITTVPTPHLDNKHVVFGEVVKGYEHIKEFEHTPSDDNDKPYTDIKIVSITEI